MPGAGPRIALTGTSLLLNPPRPPFYHPRPPRREEEHGGTFSPGCEGYRITDLTIYLNTRRGRFACF